jgi:hypothetical protein
MVLLVQLRVGGVIMAMLRDPRNSVGRVRWGCLYMRTVRANLEGRIERDKVEERDEEVDGLRGPLEGNELGSGEV